MKLIKNVIIAALAVIIVVLSAMIVFHKPIFDFLGGVIIRPSEVTLTVGESTGLSTIKPTDNIIWKSGNKKVVTIDQTGNLQAVAPGKTTVFVSNGERMGSCTVTVKAVEVTAISLDQTEIQINVGGRQKLIAQLSPENALDQSVTWESDNEEIARVGKKGMVRGVSEGITTIRATTQNHIVAECRVTVLEE